MTRHRTRVALTAALSLLSLAGCSLSTGSSSNTPPTAASAASSVSTSSTSPVSASGSSAATATTTPTASPRSYRCADGESVTLVAHDSFALPEEVLAAFTEQTGCTVTVSAQGDAGEMVNKLVLTKDSPLGDVVFGVDNTFASRVLTEGVAASSGLAAVPGAEALDLPEGSDRLTPIDFGDVCINIDDAWFATEKVAPPTTLDDLTKPAYKGLFVTPSATTSSPGLSFLLATIAAKGDAWPQYWKDLMANDVKLASGWTDAYTVDFTAGGGKDGTRPIVLSYASSIPFTIDKTTGKPTTSALLDTCFRQVEYAGVLSGAKHPEAGAAFVRFLQSPAVQAAIPDSMYMFPADPATELPADWAEHAKVAEKPLTVPPADIEANRIAWLDEWSTITGG